MKRRIARICTLIMMAAAILQGSMLAVQAAGTGEIKIDSFAGDYSGEFAKGGSWSYTLKGTEGILTLDQVNTDSTADSFFVLPESKGDSGITKLTIKFIGENAITKKNGTILDVSGFTDLNIDFVGEGTDASLNCTLNVNSTETIRGMNLTSGNTTIKSGKITIEVDNQGGSAETVKTKGLTVNQDASLDVTAGAEAYATGITAKGDISVLGKVNISAENYSLNTNDDSTYRAYGIYTDTGDLIINGGEVNVVSESEDDTAFGIIANNLTASGGRVTAEGISYDSSNQDGRGFHSNADESKISLTNGASVSFTGTIHGKSALARGMSFAGRVKIEVSSDSKLEAATNNFSSTGGDSVAVTANAYLTTDTNSQKLNYSSSTLVAPAGGKIISAGDTSNQYLVCIGDASGNKAEYVAFGNLISGITVSNAKTAVGKYGDPWIYSYDTNNNVGKLSLSKNMNLADAGITVTNTGASLDVLEINISKGVTVTIQNSNGAGLNLTGIETVEFTGGGTLVVKARDQFYMYEKDITIWDGTRVVMESAFTGSTTVENVIRAHRISVAEGILECYSALDMGMTVDLLEVGQEGQVTAKGYYGIWVTEEVAVRGGILNVYGRKGYGIYAPNGTLYMWNGRLTAEKNRETDSSMSAIYTSNPIYMYGGIIQADCQKNESAIWVKSSASQMIVFQKNEKFLQPAAPHMAVEGSYWKVYKDSSSLSKGNLANSITISAVHTLSLNTDNLTGAMAALDRTENILPDDVVRLTITPNNGYVFHTIPKVISDRAEVGKVQKVPVNEGEIDRGQYYCDITNFTDDNVVIKIYGTTEVAEYTASLDTTDLIGATAELDKTEGILYGGEIHLTITTDSGKSFKETPIVTVLGAVGEEVIAIPVDGGDYQMYWCNIRDFAANATIKVSGTAAVDILTGWQSVNGVWYYYDETGAVATGWQYIGSKWYYFSGSGAMVTGWQQVGGSWYYFSESGTMVAGWQQIDGTWYYFSGSGAMVTGWKQISGSWYYFSGSGAMVTNWQQISGTWYYFSGSGAMVTGWKQISGTWYYFSGSGAMATGWQQIGGTWYYFNTSGAMVTGWQKLSGNWYYFDASGAMAANCKITIDGIGYSFDQNGVWVS